MHWRFLADGRATRDDIKRAHPDWSDSYDFLTLLDHASLAAMPAEAMTKLQAQMAAADPVRDGPRRRAAIVCNDELSRAMLAFWRRSLSSSASVSPSFRRSFIAL